MSADEQFVPPSSGREPGPAAADSQEVYGAEVALRFAAQEVKRLRAAYQAENDIARYWQGRAHAAEQQLPRLEERIAELERVVLAVEFSCYGKRG